MGRMADKKHYKNAGVQFNTPMSTFDRIYLISIIVVFSLIGIGMVTKAMGIWAGF